jgi:uncharacterized membrane protein (DUF2068 family)
MMTEPLEEQKQEPGTDAAPAAAEDSSSHHEHRARGLLAIGLFKLAKSVFFIAIGIGALHLVHRNVGDLLLRLASILHLDPDGHFIEMLQDKADLLSGHKLRQVSLFTFGYAALSLVEGIGLMMEQKWAEYLTLILTICALPWDVTELIRHPTPVRAGVVVVNLIVLAYLLWFIRMHRKYEERASGIRANN